MFNEQEKKLIKKYCLLPKLSLTFLIMALLIGFVWIILTMINDMVFYGGFYMLGLYAYLGITIIYTICFIVCFFIPKIGMRKDKWLQIIEKAKVSMSNNDYSKNISIALSARAAKNLLNVTDNNLDKTKDALDAISAVSTVSTISQMSDEISKNAKSVASVCDIEIPKAKKYVISIILLPILLLILVYIPHYMHSKEIMDNNIALASKSIYALQSTFENNCDHVSIDDPNERYSEYGYDVRAYLYDYDDVYSSYISISIGNDGIINDVRYSLDIDIEVSKEENLERIENELLTLNTILKNSNVKALSDALLKEYTLPDEFKSQFIDNSYYEKIYYQKDECVSIDYMTESKEDYDSYSRSYIYYSIEVDE